MVATVGLFLVNICKFSS